MKIQYFIKTVFTLWSTIFFSSHSFAQQNWDILPYKNYSDFKLLNLNKSIITINILYDRMFPLANVTEYTGLPETNTDTIYPDHIMQSYYEIYNSAYLNVGMIDPDAPRAFVRSIYLPQINAHFSIYL
ncbi:MAG: hypothetical protein EAZ41_08190 [Sphingobacteriia bacterium]|nr:MAG: hypothetical protein EAZ41_08190 [Sphingobacteriia bacterium]